jgi:hypothetical protein
MVAVLEAFIDVDGPANDIELLVSSGLRGVRGHGGAGDE